MFKKIKEENKEYWIKIINDWKISKKNGLTFSKENNISSRSFYRWRSKLLNPNKPSLKINTDSFIKIENTKQLSIEIEYKKFKFNLKDFDLVDLSNFFKIIKAL
jgi:hypothetical protein